MYHPETNPLSPPARDFFRAMTFDEFLSTLTESERRFAESNRAWFEKVALPYIVQNKLSPVAYAANIAQWDSKQPAAEREERARKAALLFTWLGPGVPHGVLAAHTASI